MPDTTAPDGPGKATDRGDTTPAPPTPNQAPVAEETAGRPAWLPCRFCQIPVQQPKRKDIRKDFCSDRHRAAFRDAQVQHAIRQAQDAMQEAAADFERLAARLGGAADLLERYQRHGRRERKPKQPAAPSPELQKAFQALGVGSEEKVPESEKRD